MNDFRPVCLLLALLTGCVATTTPPPAEPSPFVLPGGSPRNVRIGFVQTPGKHVLLCAELLHLLEPVFQHVDVLVCAGQHQVLGYCGRRIDHTEGGRVDSPHFVLLLPGKPFSCNPLLRA